MDFILSFIICFLTSSLDHVAAWSYARQDQWPGSCNTGHKQSPVNIIPTKLRLLSQQKFGNIEFHNYDVKLLGILSNSGHSVVINVQNSTSQPSIRGGGLSDTYYLQQFHFHWGGAEHVLGQRRYPAEAHFVHYAQKYGTFENALSHEDGIAVLATFYDRSKRKSSAFKGIVKKLPDIAEYGTETLPLPVILKDFFPKKLDQYYRYKGSLTTPDCDEVVTWTIFENPSYIHPIQLASFSQVRSDDGNPIKYNYRKIQPLNGRKVYYYHGNSKTNFIDL